MLFVYVVSVVGAALGFLWMASHFSGVLRLVSPRIVRKGSASCALFLACCRSFLPIAMGLLLWLIAVSLYMFSAYPEPMSGGMTGQHTSAGNMVVGGNMTASGNITAEIRIQPPFSFHNTLLGIICASSAGAILAILIQQFFSLSERGYQHLRQILLPEINRLICDDHPIVNAQIESLPSSYVSYKAMRGDIDMVLAVMNRHLSC